MLDASTCAEIAQFYDGDTVPFRSTIDMARYGFGNGEYKYFAHPLPDIVTTLQTHGACIDDSETTAAARPSGPRSL